MTEHGPMDPSRLERQARGMKRINVALRFVLGLPVTTPLGGRLMLLFSTGGKPGRAYRQRVSRYVPDGDTSAWSPS